MKAHSVVLWAALACGAGAGWLPSQTTGASAAAAGGVREVVVVFKTHFDIGYTDLASNVVQRYRTSMIDQALGVVERSRALPAERQFAWTLPGWPLAQILADWPGQSAERRQRVQRAFQEGRFVVHALPFTTHTELLEPEDLVRGLDHAARLSRAAGLPLPRDAKMTDVPCHVWILPTLLRRAGVDFLHLGCNAASSSPQVPRLFWWEGPDGSRLMTMYSAESYGTGLVPPADWPYRTWLALIHTGDNHGPPTPDEVKKLFEEAARNLPGVRVRIGRLSDFADGIRAEKADLPVVRGDMPDTWIHGPLCDPAGAKLARNIRPALGAAESLQALLGGRGLGEAGAAETIAQAYEQSLLYGEHTWGGALYWVTKYSGGAQWGYGQEWKTDQAAGRFKRLEDSWAEHTAYIEKTRDLTAPLLERSLTALAQATGVPGRRITVYNPLPWPRRGLVQLRLGRGVEAFAALGGDSSKSTRPVSWQGDTLRFFADTVPASGYATLRPVPLKGRPAPGGAVDDNVATLETPVFRLVLDRVRGEVRSLWHKPTRRELADTSGPHRFGQFLYERFDSNQVAAYVRAYVKISTDWAINELGKPNLPPASQVPYRGAHPQATRVVFESTPFSTTAVVMSEAGPEVPFAVTTRYTLFPEADYMDLEVTVHNKPPDPWPEAGWICLPFKLNSPQWRLGRPGSIIDPSKDIVRGANRHLMGVHTGVALFEAGGRGVGFCPIDSPLVSLGEPGCWKYSVDDLPARPAAYVNLFNNQWTTNFRLWNQGTWTARVRLWAFDRYEPEAALITPSLEARYPLLAGAAEGAPGQLPPTAPGLRLSRKGVLVTACGPTPDRPGRLLRLWELAGQAGSCRVRLPAEWDARTAQPVDLRGQPTGPALPVKSRAFQAALDAFAPHSFLLRE